VNTIYLYVKRSPRGLFYLGKTKRNPFEYKGSGLKWKRHLSKYKIKLSDIETWILHETTSEDDLKNMGKYYSKLFNVVDSDSWANLKDEEGDGGFGSGESHPWFGRKKTLEHRKKLSISSKGNKSNLGIRKTEETKEKIRNAQKGIPRKKSVCPHCGKEGNNSTMHRWHFDKCPIKTGVRVKQSKSFIEKMSGKNHCFYGKKRPEHSKFMKENNPNSKIDVG
jgi:hypothetical protein